MTTDVSDLAAALAPADREHYTIRRSPSNVTTRWPCAFCSGSTDKTDAPFAFIDRDGAERALCDSCAWSSIHRHDQLRGYALDRLEEAAELLRLSRASFTVEGR